MKRVLFFSLRLKRTRPDVIEGMKRQRNGSCETYASHRQISKMRIPRINTFRQGQVEGTKREVTSLLGRVERRLEMEMIGKSSVPWPSAHLRMVCSGRLEYIKERNGGQSG